MFKPTATEWAGRVLKPTKDFQPVGWGSGFWNDGHGNAFGVVIDPPRFDAIARVRLWLGNGQEFSKPGKPLTEIRCRFCDLLGSRPSHLPTMVYFPLPRLDPGFYLADIAMLSDGSPMPFGVGIYDAPNWSWRAGFMTMEGGHFRRVKSPFGLAWDLARPPIEPNLLTETHGFSIPPPRFSRYDLICSDPKGKLHLLLGKDRELDPEEFGARVSLGLKKQFALHSTPNGSELIPVHEWRNGVKIGHEAKHQEYLALSRDLLPLLMAKLKAQRSISIAGYGDSITSLGGRSPDQVLQSNGTRRDTLRHFEAYGDDWRAGVPLFNGHHRLGWNWFLKATIERKWNVPVNYHNWGIAGTTSGTGIRTIDDHDYPNAAEPGRVERMLLDKPDLVVVCVGMNDIGDPIDTKSNIVSIGEAIRSTGSEMLVVGVPRQNPNFQSRDDLLWKYTHNKVIEAAKELQVAYVPLDQLYGETGAMGLSRQSHCAASFTNHPGARELAAIGEYMAQIIPHR